MSLGVRIAVLASGGGSNLQALLDADLGPGRVVCVVCNVPGARALERAADAGVEGLLIDHKGYANRAAFDAAVVDALRARDVEWVVLAGFMRVLSPTFLDAFGGRTVNIHPALLPAFPGLHAQRQALEAGVKVAGCTVHLVDAGVDTGPILAQTAIPVLPTDDEAALSRRILREEHRLLPGVVRAIAAGQLVQDVRGRPHLDVEARPGSLPCPVGLVR